MSFELNNVLPYELSSSFSAKGHIAGGLIKDGKLTEIYKYNRKLPR